MLATFACLPSFVPAFPPNLHMYTRARYHICLPQVDDSPPASPEQSVSQRGSKPNRRVFATVRPRTSRGRDRSEGRF